MLAANLFYRPNMLTLMRRLRFSLTLAFIVVALPLLVRAQSLPDRMVSSWPLNNTLFISEFMASNDVTLLDEDGDSSDWIELWNSAETPIDVGGYYLTDDADSLVKWQLPPVTTIPANGYLIIFASDKDRAVADAELHSNFKLTSAGEYLALVESDGTTVVDAYAPAYPAQSADVSYGRDATGAVGFFATPTPGAANTVGLGPEISDVSHTPAAPQADMPIQVTARIAENGSPITQVTLVYRGMFAAEQTVVMADDGLHGDGAANDGVYGATILAGIAQPGEMVRYAVRAQDASDVSRLPLSRVAANAPHYFGLVVADDALDGNLPILHWFVEDVDSAETRDGTRASIQYDNRFYDNIFVRVRGGTTSLGPKFSFKFDMNNGDWFAYAPDVPLMEEFNVNSTTFDSTAMRSMLGYDAHRDAGQFASLSSALRVQRNGGFYSVATFVEHLDERFLERHALDPSGALYQMNGSYDSATANVEKKTRQHENNSDLQALIDALTLPTVERDRYLFDHFNIPNLIDHLAIRTTLSDWDSVCHNSFLHRDSDGTGEWRILPWDKDLVLNQWSFTFNQDNERSHPLFGGSQYPLTHPGEPVCWNRLYNAVFESPTLREMYLRRLRSVMDQVLQPPDTPYSERYLETRVDAYAAQLSPDIYLDNQTWTPIRPFDTAINARLKPFLVSHRTALYETHAAANGGLVPDAQAGTPLITIETVVFFPDPDRFDGQYVRLHNPNSFAVDLSGWQLGGGTAYQFITGVVIPAGGDLYVARDPSLLRAQSASTGDGRFIIGGLKRLEIEQQQLTLLNAAGVEIDAAAYGFADSGLRGRLIVSEIHYNPSDNGAIDGDAFEFVELMNVSSQSIDLGGVQVVDGISATLPAHTLMPGDVYVLVRDASAFAERYPATGWGSGYDKQLDNRGERLTLLDANERIVTSFVYDDVAPWPTAADGAGYSLERVAADAFAGEPCSWRASDMLHGTPGSHVFAASNDCWRLFLPLVTR